MRQARASEAKSFESAVDDGDVDGDFAADDCCDLLPRTLQCDTLRGNVPLPGSQGSTTYSHQRHPPAKMSRRTTYVSTGGRRLTGSLGHTRLNPQWNLRSSTSSVLFATPCSPTSHVINGGRRHTQFTSNIAVTHRRTPNVMHKINCQLVIPVALPVWLTPFPSRFNEQGSRR